MIWRYILIVPLAFLCSLPMVTIVQGSSDAAASDKEIPRVSTTAASDRVQITVEALAAAVAGTALDFTVTIKNLSNETVNVFDRNGWHNVSVSVFDSDKLEVPLTRWGSATLQTQEDDAVFGIVVAPLRSGEEITFRKNLARVHDLTVSGNYTLKLRWHSARGGEGDPQKMDELTAELAFKVVDPGQEADEVESAEPAESVEDDNE